MKTFSKRIYAILSTIITFIMLAPQAFATQSATDRVASSKIATGTTQLIADLTRYAQGIALAAAVFFAIYFQIRKSGADEQDQKMWSKRTKTAIVSGIIATIAIEIVNLIVSYYK